MKLEEAIKLWDKYQSQTSIEEATVLYHAVLKSLDGAIVEVGSASGGTTIVLIGAAEEVGKTVYSIDPYPEELEGVALDYPVGSMKTLKENFKNNILNGQWKNIIQYSEDITNCIENLPEKIAIAFVDGCHEFSLAQKDVAALLPRIVSGGEIFVHDNHWSVGQISKTEGTGVNLVRGWIEQDNSVVVGIIPNTSFLHIKKK
jgi:predicted O-methyltransferase YrrM